MYRVYGMAASGNCYKLKLLLTQLGQAFDWIETDITKGQSRTAEFLARNPNGKVPTLELPDGSFLPESNAILFYLAEGTPFLPADRMGRARALQWMFFEQYSHEPFIATVRYWVHILGKRDEYAAQIAERTPKGYAALDVMEQHLGRQDFFVPGGYSIADIALFAYTHVAGEGGFELARYPKIRAWFDRVRAQPNFVPMG